MNVRLTLAATFLCSALVFGQKPEYEFYAGYRDLHVSTLDEKIHPLPPGKVHEAYEAKLKKERVSEVEIQRRLRLLNTEQAKLEADRWEPFFYQRHEERRRVQPEP